jgi:DNA-binding response OmpR family regulator
VRIILVENEADIGRLVTYVLKSQGFTVDHVFDVPSAEEKIREGSYDLMLLDLMMPGEDGYSFCKRLKSNPETQGLPVVIISARVMPNEIKRAMECGANGYITKPYNTLTLADDIRKIYEESTKNKPTS